MNDAISTRTTMTLLGWKNNGIKFKCHDFYGGRFLILRNATMNVSAFFQCHFIFSFSLSIFFCFLCNESFPSLFVDDPIRSWPFSIRKYSVFFLGCFLPFCSVQSALLSLYFRLQLRSDLFGTFLFVNIQFHLVYIGLCAVCCVLWYSLSVFRLSETVEHTCNGHIYNLVNCNHCHYRVATHCKFKRIRKRSASIFIFIANFHCGMCFSNFST